MKKIGLSLLGMASVICIGLAQNAPKIDGKIDTKEYANTYKHAQSTINLSWQVVGDTIYLAFTSPSKGWTGLGFNPTGSKKEGGDMYMFMFDNNKLMSLDMFQTKATGAPKLDTDEGGKNDILSSAGTSNSTGMVIEFSRKLDTKDKTDEAILLGKANKLLLAVGETPSATKSHKRGERWEASVTFK
jgi:hypothetical protein